MQEPLSAGFDGLGFLWNICVCVSFAGMSPSKALAKDVVEVVRNQQPLISYADKCRLKQVQHI